MAQLIQPQRAIELCPNFVESDLQVLTDIVGACSSLIETYLNRTFAVTAYDELLDGTGHLNILLTQYPVVSLDRMMFNPTLVISIGNNKTSVSRASFRLDKTSLYLDSVDNGVETKHTIARSACPTFNDLAQAVNAFASEGWKAQALGIYTNWLTSDLYAPQGGHEVRWTGFGYLWHHAFGVPAAMQNTDIGEILSSYFFQRGYQNYRALYTAGFPVVPPEIQQACAELAAAVYQQRGINPNLQSETLGQYSYTNLAEKSFSNLSIASRYALNQYRNLRVVKYKSF